MKTWVFLQGGYFHGTLYGVIDEENLPDEILLHHYENPKAIVAGVTILGITKKEEGDVTVVEKYTRPPVPPIPSAEGQMLHYNFNGLVDPQKVKKRVIAEPEGDDEYGDYVLEEVENGE